MKNTVLAVIPARMGSKGVPGKNIKELGGKPLIFWTIDAALELVNTGEISEVWVTSESLDLLGMCITEYGERINTHIRQPEYAQDFVQTDEVYCDFLRSWQLDNNATPDILVLLQPTSPFRNAEVIRQALSLYLMRMPRHTVVSVTTMESAFYWQGTSYGAISPVGHEPRDRLGRQDEDFTRLYKESGAVYVTHGPTFSKYRSYRKDPFWPLVIEKWQALDIDTPEDWAEAERICDGLQSVS